jgi:hypothetical protein
MYLHEILLFIITFLVVFLTPAYIHFRNNMVKEVKPKAFTRKRIIKVTLINMLLILGVNSLSQLLLFSMIFIKPDGFVNSSVFFLTGLFFLVSGFTFYGSGIYISSIMMESYTRPSVMKSHSFKTQFIATHLFHGPISHVLIYSGLIINYFILSTIDFATGSTPIISKLLLSIAGIILGGFYSMAQVYNRTIMYQFITALLSLGAYYIVIIVNEINITDFSFGIFYSTFLLSFIISGIFYLIHYKITKPKYQFNIWDI